MDKILRFWNKNQSIFENFEKPFDKGFMENLHFNKFLSQFMKNFVLSLLKITFSTTIFPLWGTGTFSIVPSWRRISTFRMSDGPSPGISSARPSPGLVHLFSSRHNYIRLSLLAVIPVSLYSLYWLFESGFISSTGLAAS